jgi:hypothetical protein
MPGANSSFKLLLGIALLPAYAADVAYVDHFTDNGFGNPSSTLQHPTGEHFKGTTYIAYQGPHEDSYVAAYHHATRKWSGPVLAGVNVMGKTPDPISNVEVDNHGKPAMMVDGKGYIHVVYGAHGGTPLLGENKLGTPGGLRGGKLTHVVSRNPEDISSWVVLDNISPFGTYPQFVQMDDGDIYLFYRHGAHRSDWVYQKSSDDGRTFAPPVSVLKHKVHAPDPTVHDAWYAWFGKGHGDTIAASYVYHPCANPGHTKDRLNAYYMKLNGADDSWESAAGEKLVLPVTKEYADKKTLALSSGKERCSHGTCRMDNKGNPHLLFQYGKQISYLRWTGSAWTSPVAVLPGGANGDGDLMVESPTTARAILTSNNGKRGEVGWWKTTDGGKSWLKEPPLLSKAGGGYDIGALLENPAPEGQIIVSEGRPSEYLYKRMILLGTSGPARRPVAEASYIEAQLKRLRAAGLEPESKEARAASQEKRKARKK